MQIRIMAMLNALSSMSVFAQVAVYLLMVIGAVVLGIVCSIIHYRLWIQSCHRKSGQS